MTEKATRATRRVLAALAMLATGGCGTIAGSGLLDTITGGARAPERPAIAVSDVRAMLDDLRDDLQCRPSQQLAVAEQQIERQRLVIAEHRSAVDGLTIARDALVAQVADYEADLVVMAEQLSDAQLRLERIISAAAAAAAEED